MAPSKADALARIERSNQDRLRSSGGRPTQKFNTEVRDSLLDEYNGANLISAAPVGLALLGACFIASASPEAERRDLESAKPEGGWKYLESFGRLNLKTSLVQIGNRGRIAFTTASEFTSQLSEMSGPANQCVQDVIMMLQQQPEPRIITQAFSKLQEIADGSARSCERTEKGFLDWLFPVLELYAITAQTQGGVDADAKGSRARKLLTDLQAADTTKQSAEEAVKVLSKVLGNAGAAFERANRDTPSGWETVITGASSAITQAFPSFVAQALPPLTATPPTDDAYNVAPQLSPLVNHLYTYLTQGPANGVDWDKLNAQGTKYLLENVKGLENSANLGANTPSTSLKSAIAKISKTLEALKAGSSGTSSDTVKVWQSDIRDAKATILQLEAAAKSFPGTSADSVSIRSEGLDVSRANPTDQAAALSAAIEKIAIGQASLGTAEKTIQTGVESSSKVQEQLLAIQSKLKGVSFDTETLEKVNDVLNDTVSVVYKLVTEYRTLRSFYILISAIVKNALQPSLEGLQGQSRGRGPSSGGTKSDFTTELVTSITLQTKVFFEVLTNVARLYSNVDRENISPGLQLVEQLSVPVRDSRELQGRREQFNRFNDGVTPRVRGNLEQKQRESREKLGEKVNGVAEQVQDLERQGISKPEEVFAAAIKTGAGSVAEHVARELPQKQALWKL